MSQPETGTVPVSRVDARHGGKRGLCPFSERELTPAMPARFSFVSPQQFRALVAYPGGWTAYLVDVSGHGVRAGVLMGMVKSAARMALRRPLPLARWITEVSEVLHPLRASSMYATAAAVQAGPAGLSFTVAGHLPILRVRAADGAIEEHTIPQVPLAMFDDREFAEAPLACEPGDLLVLVTDGLTEVFDARDRELGLDAVKALVAERRSDPLAGIADALVAAARAHGPQQDDQTVLLLRRLA